MILSYDQNNIKEGEFFYLNRGTTKNSLFSIYQISYLNFFKILITCRPQL